MSTHVADPQVHRPVVVLRPAIYSKSQMTEALCRNVGIAPYQTPNTDEAWKGHVADLQLEGERSPYGTMQEWWDAFHPEQIVVLCRDGKVFIRVELDDYGTPYFVVRGHTKL